MVPYNRYESFEIKRKSQTEHFDLIARTMNETSYVDGKYKEKNEYTYKIVGIKTNGEKIIIGFAKVFTNMLPKEFMLRNPNPSISRGDFSISFDIPMRSEVELKILDVSGRVVMDAIRKVMDAGYYRETINAEKLSTGTYFIMMESKDYRSIKKIVRIK